MTTEEPTTEVNSNSQMMENAEKYPQVLELFSNLLLNLEGIKLKKKKRQSELRELFEQSRYEPDLQDPSNSVLAYISYWYSIFLCKGNEFIGNRSDLFAKIVLKIKPVASDVAMILNKEACVNWIDFSKLLPSIKYSGNALKREYLSFFSEIRETIKEIVRMKVGTRQTLKKKEAKDANREFESLLQTQKLDDKDIEVKGLISRWVQNFIDYQFTDQNEFVDNLMLLIPYTYLIHLKGRSLTGWGLEEFLQAFENMDSANDSSLLSVDYRNHKNYVPTNPSLFFTSTLLERPASFFKENLPILVHMIPFGRDNFHIVIRVSSHVRVNLSYSKIFCSSFYAKDYSYPDPGLRWFDGGKREEEQTIYNFISRWMERQSNCMTIGPFHFMISLLSKLALIEPEFWEEQMNETSERLREYHVLLEDYADGEGFHFCDTDATDSDLMFDQFCDQWVKKLVPNFIKEGSDDSDLRTYLSGLRRPRP